MTAAKLDDRDLDAATGGLISTKWVDMPTRDFKAPDNEMGVLQSIEETETGLFSDTRPPARTRGQGDV
ncbi:MAG: hypothetical protein AAGH68_12845 [Pseudomonadota bacterium]